MKKYFFDKVDTQFVEKFKEEVSEDTNIVLASHISPDDDSISSVLALHYYLTEILRIPEKRIRILYTWEKTKQWSYFERFAKILFVDDIANHIKKDDLIIFTDGSGWQRFSRSTESSKLKNFVICIDHHPTPDEKFDLHIVVKDCTSTAELVYRLFFEKEKLEKEICEIILMGILGDTGNFRFVKPEQSEIFSIARRLVDEGEIIVEALENKYQYMSLKVYKALQELMKNSRIEKVKNWPDFLISYIDQKFVKENGLSESDVADASGSFTPYLKNLKGVNWGIVMTPGFGNSYYRVSLRSVPGSVSVRDLMERTKFGGGHDRAAGGKIKSSDPEKVLELLTTWMESNEPLLN